MSNRVLTWGLAVLSIFSISCVGITNKYRVEVKDFTPYPRAAQITEAILNHPLVTRKDVKIYVSNDATVNKYRAYTNGKDKIFLSARLLFSYENRYLDAIIAHELGHIEYDTRNQNEADLFAAMLVGKTRYIEYLEYLKYSRTANSKDSEIDLSIEYLENKLSLK